MATIIGHLSDPHLNVERDDRRARLSAVLDHLARLRQLDAVVITGDLADRGRDAEYAQLTEELSARLPGTPVVVTTGNHDDHEGFVRAFGARHFVSDTAGIRIIGLDSSPIERPQDLRDDAGQLDDDALRFARAAVTSTDAPVIIALHHPPVAIGHAAIDQFSLMRPAALSALLADAPNVVAILTGHVHTAHTSAFAGVPVVGAPGVASTLDPHVTDRIRADASYPPGYAMHAVERRPGERGRIRSRFFFVPWPGVVA